MHMRGSFFFFVFSQNISDIALHHKNQHSLNHKCWIKEMVFKFPLGGRGGVRSNKFSLKGALNDITKATCSQGLSYTRTPQRGHPATKMEGHGIYVT